MSFTGPGWYLLSTTTDQTISQAMASWGISTSIVYKYIYELKNAPIKVSPTAQLTADNWMGTDISANPTSLLNPMKAYWVNIQTLILDIVLRGTGTETLSKSAVAAKLSSTSTSPVTNVIIQGYTGIGTNAFSGVTNLSTVTIVSGSQLISSSIASNAFSNSGLKTVIFESISDLQGLGFIISDAPQSFFGTSCLVLPTKVAVQGALAIMQLQMPSYQTTFTQAQSAFNTATGAVATQEKAVQTAEDTQSQANNAAQAAQAALNRIVSEYGGSIVIAEMMTSEYNETLNQLTSYQNQLISATIALAFAKTHSTAAQATLAAAQTLLTQANNSLYNFQGQFDALTTALKWPVYN